MIDAVLHSYCVELKLEGIRLRRGEMKICRLVYMSERNTSARFSIKDIVQKSCQNNARVNVTGFLAFDGVYFIHALDGSRTAVTQIFNCIVCDRRHMNFYLISCQDANDRLFPKWPMGLLDGISADARDRLLN